MRRLGWFFAAAAVLHAASVQLEIDRAKSHIVVVTRKGGIFSFAGHEHGILATEWSADVCFDRENPAASSAHITISVPALRIDTAEAREKAGVSAKGPSPKDVQEIQARMLARENLDAAQHPTIEFKTTSVAGKGSDTLVLTGPLTIRGRALTVSAPAKLERRGEETLFSGEFRIKQSDYGIKPVSIGGVVNVRDPVEIRFVLAASPTAKACP
jgi:polyisoprenoid-binding protein YceI